MTVPANARALAALPDEARRAVLADLSSDELASLEFAWEFWARFDQLPPEGDWRTWVMLSGRGAGKTRAAGEFVRRMVEAGRHRAIAIVGPTASSIRRDMIEGSSGLLAIAPPWCRPEYQPSSLRIVWPNGAIAHLLSAEEPDRIRGLNADLAWADELASWANQQSVWDMLQLSLRIPGPKGDAPRVVVSTTPKPGRLLKNIIASPTTVVTRATTMDNAANLDASTLAHYRRMYEGTTLGRQELNAEILDSADGALWNRDIIDRCHVAAPPETQRRVVIAIDPSGGSSEANAETGIIAACTGLDGHGYVLADASGRYSPEGWATCALDMYDRYGADVILAEQNFGGAMVEATIRVAARRHAKIQMVQASRGKAIRAQPVAHLYTQNLIHHVGAFPDLEDQMCQWTPDSTGPSPDRLDALVWAFTELLVNRPNLSVWADL